MKKLIVGISAEGSVNLLRGQMQYFKDHGYDTYLISPFSERSSEFCKKEGCHHLIVPVKREISLISDIVNLIRILAIFIRVRPDIINLGTPKVSLLGMIAGKLLGVKKRIYTCRGFRYEHERGAKRKVLIAMEKVTAACAHQVICISPSVKKLGIEDGIFSEDKSIVINKGSSNGIDLHLFDRSLQPENAIADIRGELGLTDTFVFGYAGRIVDRKGIRELYDAFDLIYRNDNRVRLLLVGPYEHAQLLDKALVTDVERHPGILYLGRKGQQEVPLYLSLMDVFVLPAWWEGFGNVLVQAAAMGIPVISTWATGTQDAVSNGYNGILVPPRSVDKLRNAMTTLYNDPGLRAKYGENGKAWARNFDSKLIWQGMDDLYKKDH